MEYISTRDFMGKIEEGKKAIVVITAEWCSPCKTIKKLLTEMKPKLNSEVFALDIEKNSDFVRFFYVQSLPTTFFIDKGEVVEEKVGMPPIGKFKQLVEEFERR